MESQKNYITSRQLIMVLLIARLGFSSAFIAGIGAGSSVQDILLSIPVLFFTDLVVGAPILLLLKRHPGKDLMECCAQALGKPLGILTAMVYFLLFTFATAVLLSTFNCFYSINFLKESFVMSVTIPILLVSVYGAVRGIESICRFGTLVAILYLLMLALIFGSVTGQVDIGYLSPLFYSGHQVFFRAVAAGIVTGLQPLAFAMCAPFLRPNSKIVKTYVLWDLFSSILMFILFFYLITVMGPFTSTQIFPLQTISLIAQLSVFERLDSFVMVAWVSDTVLALSLYLYAASQCLLRTPVKKFRKSIIFAAALIALALNPFLTKNYLKYLTLYFNPSVLLLLLIFLLLIPVAALLADIMKEKLSGQMKSQG